MNKFKFYFIVSCTLFTLFSCHKADDVVYTFPHPYGSQYDYDSSIIKNYLESHYIDPNQSPDDEIVISDASTSPTTQRIIDSPLLQSINVDFAGVTHTIYYLKLRTGTGAAPSKVDQVLVAYNGSYLSTSGANVFSNIFQSQPIPQNFFSLDQTIKGWSEIIPLFHAGTLQPGDGSNPPVYTDYGVGVMFLPSAFGYYNVSQASIPAYSPLVFTFKVYDVKRSDQDGDGIVSVDEATYDSVSGVYTFFDTDGDGTSDYYDRDDDGDGYLTVNETKKPDGYNDPTNVNYCNCGESSHYPYNPTTDNPLTPDVNESETIAVPDCSGDATNPVRLRKYLDPTCH